MSRRINARDQAWWDGDPQSTLNRILREAPGLETKVYLPYEDGSPWDADLRIARRAEFYGDGYDESLGLRGTVTLATRGAYLHDLTIVPAGDGIRCDFSQLSGGAGGDLVLERVGVFRAGGHGFHATPGYREPDFGFLIRTSIRDCEFSFCAGDGMRFEKATTTVVASQVNCLANGGHGLWAQSMVSSTFDAIVAENCGLDLAIGVEAPIYLSACESVELNKPWVERFAARNAIVLDACQETAVRSGILTSVRPGWDGVRVRNNSWGCIVEPQRIPNAGCVHAVLGDASVSGCVISPQQRKVDGFDWSRNRRLW